MVFHKPTSRIPALAYETFAVVPPHRFSELNASSLLEEQEISIVQTCDYQKIIASFAPDKKFEKDAYESVTSALSKTPSSFSIDPQSGISRIQFNFSVKVPTFIYENNVTNYSEN